MKASRNQSIYILLGTIIGAGFASGQEIITFFIRFGKPGLYGLIGSGLIWILSFRILFYVIRKERVTSYSQLTDILFGHEIGTVYQILVTVFMFLSLSIMLSGTGTLFSEQWDLPPLLGSVLMGFFTYLTIRYGQQGLSRMNQILAPFLVIGILVSSLLIILSSYTETASLCLTPIPTLQLQYTTWYPVFFHTLLYISYNMISVIILFSSCPVVYPRRTAVCTGLILLLLSLSLGVATFLNYGTIIEIEIPIPALLTFNSVMRSLYMILLICAMYTTAIGNAYSCMQSLESQSKCPFRQKLTLPLLLIAAIFASRMGFTILIEKGYTFFGYIGLLQLLLLFRKAFHHKQLEHP